MALSNSYSFTFTLQGLITTAFQLTNIYQSEDTINDADYNVALVLLNSMIKSWETQGIKLWKRRQAVLFPDLNAISCELGQTGTNCANTFATSTTTAALAASATVVPVLAVTGMNVGDNIGIELDDGTRQFTTIVSIAALNITITTGLTTTAALGNTIVTYTTKINRPLAIRYMTTYDLATKAENQVADLSFDEYFGMPIKTTPGRPNNYYYDKLLGNGVLYTYPVTNNVNQLLKFVYFDSLMDMINQSDNFDFPQEWYHTVLYNLCIELIFAFQNFVTLPLYQAQAQALLQAAKQWDGDDATLKIKVTKRRY